MSEKDNPLRNSTTDHRPGLLRFISAFVLESCKANLKRLQQEGRLDPDVDVNKLAVKSYEKLCNEYSHLLSFDSLELK